MRRAKSFSLIFLKPQSQNIDQQRLGKIHNFTLEFIVEKQKYIDIKVMQRIQK